MPATHSVYSNLVNLNADSYQYSFTLHLIQGIAMNFLLKETLEFPPLTDFMALQESCVAEPSTNVYFPGLTIKDDYRIRAFPW